MCSFIEHRPEQAAAPVLPISENPSQLQGRDASVDPRHTISFAVGETSKTVTVDTLSDALLEAPETVVATLTSTSASGVINSAANTATATIVDVPPPPPPKSSISGSVYVDANDNGTRDAGETGIAGVEITLIGSPGTVSTTTDADGRYTFVDISAGSYMLVEPTQPAGCTSPTAHARLAAQGFEPSF